MNYSFNADYREVAKRLQHHNYMRLYGGAYALYIKMRALKRALKWPWC